MAISDLKGRSLLCLADYTAEEIHSLVELAAQLKKESHEGRRGRRLEGYTLALIFEKPSTRTRCAFETAFAEEGGHPVFLSPTDIHLGKKETVEDTARVLGRMFDAIQFRGFDQGVVEKLAEYSGVPVYNGLTDLYHPTQILADLQTIAENFGDLKGRRVVYVGDARNNVARSLMLGCAKLGLHFTAAAPAELTPDSYSVDQAREFARESGSEITITTDPFAGVAGADVVYTDVWVSMGEEDKAAGRLKMLAPYRVTSELMSATRKKDSVFLHCLPAVRGNEMTDEVIEGPQSRVFDEAENRKHTIKAVLLASLGVL